MPPKIIIFVIIGIFVILGWVCGALDVLLKWAEEVCKWVLGVMLLIAALACGIDFVVKIWRSLFG